MKDFLAWIRTSLHLKADRRRLLAYGQEAEWQVQGLPQEWIDKELGFTLAVADLLDALAGPRRTTP